MLRVDCGALFAGVKLRQRNGAFTFNSSHVASNQGDLVRARSSVRDAHLGNVAGLLSAVPVGTSPSVHPPHVPPVEFP